MRKVLYILGELEDSDLQWLVDAGTLRNLAPRTSIIEEGGAIESLFIVVNGELEVRKGGRAVARLSTGEVVGEMSLLDSRPPTATVTSVGEVLVYSVPQTALRKKLADDPGFGSRFHRALCVFLANRLSRTDLLLNANASRIEEQEAESDVSPEVLQNVAVAGARFDWFLQRVRGSAAT